AWLAAAFELQRSVHRIHDLVILDPAGGLDPLSWTPTVGAAISNWVAQADRDAGKRKDSLTSSEREELARLRKENRQLKLEREILSKSAAWFAQETVPNSKRSSGS